MKIKVYINSNKILSFEDVAAVTMNDSRVDASAGRYDAVAQWTRYGEESGSEEMVNVDPARARVSGIAIIDLERFTASARGAFILKTNGNPVFVLTPDDALDLIDALQKFVAVNA